MHMQASLYAAGPYYCQYSLAGNGGIYDGHVAITIRSSVHRYFSHPKIDSRLRHLDASVLKHGAFIRGFEYFKWAVSNKKVESRKTEFVTFEQTSPWMDLHALDGGFDPTRGA
ncbi:hypothetical protein FRC02_003685 [Tulasnella sp. 418]|nr:hypothetical protein FRC02_003685 [Tulasnella sp. 418]